jgi:hypothetical protein
VKWDRKLVVVSWGGRLPLFRHHRGETKEESMSLGGAGCGVS